MWVLETDTEMNGALFLLTVNFLIAQLFCVFFLVISRRSRIPSAGRWFAAAFAVASLSAVFRSRDPLRRFRQACEFLVPSPPY